MVPIMTKAFFKEVFSIDDRMFDLLEKDPVDCTEDERGQIEAFLYLLLHFDENKEMMH